MNIKDLRKPVDLKSLGVLGYLVVLNNQVHSYQMKALEEYLAVIDCSVDNTCLSAIISGVEESLSYAASYAAFSKEDMEVKKDILYLMYVLSYADNHFEDSERDYIAEIIKVIDADDAQIEEIKENAITEAQAIRAANNTIFSRSTYKKEQSFLKSIWNWIKRIVYRLLRKDFTENVITDKDYQNVIDKCAKIANEDLSIVEPAYTRVLEASKKTIESINAYKRNLSLETGLSASVAETVSCFVNILNKEVVEHTDQELLALEQKRRTISDFTISLIGRTKAGKSTLHAILTEQGKDRIGVGKQRTTRYNWVYQWNLLRIIDTPGIGSAEAGGRKDEEIAESVLGESDVICFVVADDSILKDVLEFIERVALLNKPIIILLNHKENIRPEVKFRRFIDNPKQWLDDNSETNLKGHENRIRKYAEDRGFGNLVNVYPVFLLAALMADEEEYEQYRDILWKNSNVEKFINQISSWILQSGSIKRSQTILDESIHVFAEAQEAIKGSSKVIEDQIVFLEGEKKEKIGQLRSTVDEVINNIKEILTERFQHLAHNEALLFAEEYIGTGTRAGKDVDEKWEAYIERINFEKEVRADIDEAINIYKDKVDRTVKELFEDFLYSVNMSFTVNHVDIPIQFDLRSAARLTFGAVGLAGAIVGVVLGASNPVGWVLSIIGAVGTIITQFLFKSKETRRKEAIDKVYIAIKDAIEKAIPDQVNSIIDQIRNDLNENADSIESVFDELSDGLKKTLGMSDSMSGAYREEIDMLNKAYAWRIVQFLEGKQDRYDRGIVDKDIVSIDRSKLNEITIRTASSHRVNTEGLKTVLAEKITIGRK